MPVDVIYHTQKINPSYYPGQSACVGWFVQEIKLNKKKEKFIDTFCEKSPYITVLSIRNDFVYFFSYLCYCGKYWARQFFFLHNTSCPLSFIYSLSLICLLMNQNTLKHERTKCWKLEKTLKAKERQHTFQTLFLRLQGVFIFECVNPSAV